MILIKDLGIRIMGVKNKYNVKFGIFKCEYCNKLVETRYINGLRNKTCGCKRYDLASKNNTLHGDSNKNAYYFNLFGIWTKMKGRCNNPNNNDYKYYGGKGIKIDPIWNNYINFKEWSLNNGYVRYQNLQIDRINGNKNYSPDNCRWVTPKINQRNRKTVILNEEKVSRIKIFIFELNISTIFLSKIYGVSYSTILDIKRNKTWKDVTYKKLFI